MICWPPDMNATSHYMILSWNNCCLLQHIPYSKRAAILSNRRDMHQYWHGHHEHLAVKCTRALIRFQPHVSNVHPQTMVNLLISHSG